MNQITLPAVHVFGSWWLRVSVIDQGEESADKSIIEYHRDVDVSRISVTISINLT
jgi:hypothetical protein